jgi:hypothetical protein
MIFTRHPKTGVAVPSAMGRLVRMSKIEETEEKSTKSYTRDGLAKFQTWTTSPAKRVALSIMVVSSHF